MNKHRSARLGWTLATLIFVIGAAYVLGGNDELRQLNRSIRRWMDPPTQAQMQRAVAAEAQQASIDSITRADTVGRHADAPASPRFILATFSIAFAVVAATFLASIRWTISVPRATQAASHHPRERATRESLRSR
ncbi:MAG TPA: hypothetical protein VN706_12010 [Gemmatimonadaceae bacterium]|nr:hypothetical protein [Gemmatimonadaceae bacterium]